VDAATKTGVNGRGPVVDDREPGDVVNTLPAVLDLTEAQSLRNTVAALLADRSLILDASGVERMSTPCSQILLAAGRAADLAGSSFRIVDASEVFRTALADLGLNVEFGKWMV
jgi:anti-anti-sigma regulatory factor